MSETTPPSPPAAPAAVEEPLALPDIDVSVPASASNHADSIADDSGEGTLSPPPALEANDSGAETQQPTHHPPPLHMSDVSVPSMPQPAALVTPPLPFSSTLAKSQSVSVGVEPGHCRSPAHHPNADSDNATNFNDNDEKDEVRFSYADMFPVTQPLPSLSLGNTTIDHSSGNDGHNHRFSIVIDNVTMRPIVEDEKFDNPIMGECEPGRSLPSLSMMSEPLTPLSPLTSDIDSGRTFSFSYASDSDSDNDEDNDSKSLAVAIGTPDQRRINDRYNLPEGDRRRVNFDHNNGNGKDIEERKSDNVDDDDDINVVHHYHTVRNPDSVEAVHFVSNPLLASNADPGTDTVITIETHHTAEGETLTQAMERQRAIIEAKEQQTHEKAERRARRAERRALMEARRAAAVLAAQALNDGGNDKEAVVMVYDSLSPTRGHAHANIGLQPSLASPRAQQSPLSESESPMPLSPSPLSPLPSPSAPVLTIEEEKEDGGEENGVGELPVVRSLSTLSRSHQRSKKVASHHHSESVPTIPSHAAGNGSDRPRHMVKAEEKRPAKLNLPSRNKDDSHPSNDDGNGGRGGNAELPSQLVSSSVHVQSRRLANSVNASKEIKTPEVASRHLSSSPVSPSPASPSPSSPTPASKPKLSLKQLVSVSWLPKEPAFPHSKQSKYDSYRTAAYDKDYCHQMPVINDSLATINDRLARLSLPGPDNDRRHQHLSSLPKPVMDNLEDVPHRFTVETMIAQHHRLSGGDAKRLVGREAIVSVSDSGQSHIYHELVLVDDSHTIDKTMIDTLNTFTNCHHLIINDTKIVQTKLMLPNLLSLTLSNNKVASLSTLTHLTLHTPLLSSLTVINNPVNAKIPIAPATGLPPIEHELWKFVLLPLQSLMWFNGAKIDNLTRFSAYQYHKSKASKLCSAVSLSLWYSAIDYEPTISAMTQWRYGSIQSLTLSHLSLLAVHLHCLSHCQQLTKLDLSHNHLTSLSHSGVQTLPSLQHLDMSDNEVLSVAELSVLAHCPALTSLILTNNLNLRDYRSPILYQLRYLRGLESGGGLQSLDGTRVSVDEKIKYYASHDRNEAYNLHWNLLCAGHYTQSDCQAQSPSIVSLVLTNQSLHYSDVSKFVHVEYLNLSANHLKYINGLEALTILKYCDLSSNSELNLKATLSQLGQLTTLTHVSLGNAHTSNNNSNKVEHFQRVLTALFPKNSRLCCIDGRLVDVNDYITVTKKSSTVPLDDETLVEYRWALTLTLDYYRIMRLQACTAKKDKTLTLAIPSTVHYTREQIIEQVTLIAPKLRELYGYSVGLSDKFSLSLFNHLSYLNLNHNRLTTVTGLHLSLLPSLQYIDLRNNKIKDSHSVVARCLTTLNALKGVCLAGNPCVSGNKSYRTKLIESMDSLANIHCVLKVIDTAITVEERVQAYTHRLLTEANAQAGNDSGHGGGSGNDRRGSLTEAGSKASKANTLKIAQFRFLLSLQHNLPSGAQFHTVTELVLVDQRLTFVDCMGFPLLEKLFLGKNELTSLKQTGIETLGQLKVLDLRNNRLTSLQELIDLLTKLRLLEFIGAKENKFKEGSKYRHHLMAGLIQLVGHNHSLRFIDDIELGADELVQSLAEISNVSNHERERWRFAEVIKQYVDLPSLVELDISGCKLQCAEFARFPNLKKLILNNNLFTDDGLEQSGIEECQHLAVLEINDNQLKSIQRFAALFVSNPLTSFNQLAIISMIGNPMVAKDDRPRRLLLSYYPTLLDSEFLLTILNGETVTIEERVNAYVLGASRGGNDKGKHHRRVTGGSVDFVMTPIPRARRLSDGGDQPINPALPAHRGSLSVMRESYSSIASPYVLHNALGQQQSQSQLLSSPYTNPSLLLSSNIHYTAEAARCHLTLLSMFRDKDAAYQQSLKTLKLRSLNLMFVGGANGVNKFTTLRSLDLRNNDIESLEHQGLDSLHQLHTLDLRNNKIVSIANIVSNLHKCHQLEVLAIHRATKSDETNVPDRYLDTMFSSLRGLTLCDGYKTNLSLHSNTLSLSALNLLHKLNGVGPNELHEVHLTDIGGKKELLPYILASLYHLSVTRLRLDGDNEWCLLPEYTDLVIILMGKHLTWFDGTDIGEDRRYLALQVNEKKKLDRQRLIWDEVWEEAHTKVDTFLALEEKQRKNKTINDQKKKGAFFNANIPQTLSVSNATAGAGAASSILAMSTTALSSILSKLEIVVQFLQIQSINLSVDLNIPWPKMYVDFSSFTNWFTVNIYNMIDINGNFAHILLFSLLISLPLVLLVFFYWFHSLRVKQTYYAKQLIDQWLQTKLIALFVFVVLLLLSFVIGLFAAGGGQGLSNLMAGQNLNSESFTVILILASAMVVIFLLWLIIAKVFRYHYQKDLTEDKLVFRSKWLSILNWGQIIIMFILTITFMPISRLILSEFTCSSDSGSDQCFPSNITVIQILSFLFGLIYIIGLPLFYVRMINRTVKLVLSTSRIYAMNEEKLTTLKNDYLLYSENFRKEAKMLSKQQLKKKKKEKELYSKNYSTTINALYKQQYSLYYSIVNQPENQVPASSLYASFTRQYRFWKIIQMFQKLLLIIIALFAPARWGQLTSADVVSSGVVIAFSAVSVIMCRPYNDKLEDVMDGMAGVANTINAAVAIGLSYSVSFLDGGTSDIILLVANGATLLAFLIAFVFVPARAFWHAQQTRVKEQQEEKAEEEKKAREEKRKAKCGHLHANTGSGGNGGGVKPVSEEEFSQLENHQKQMRLVRGHSDGHTHSHAGTIAVMPPSSPSPVRSQPLSPLSPMHASPSTGRRELRGSLSVTPTQRHRRHSSMQLPIIDERVIHRNAMYNGDATSEFSPSPLLTEPKSPIIEMVEDSVRHRRGHFHHARSHSQSFSRGPSPKLATRSHAGSLSISIGSTPKEQLSPVARQYAIRAMNDADRERKSSLPQSHSIRTH